jgi:hypothetical protein
MTAEREAQILDAYLRWGSVKHAAFVACASKDTVRRIAKAVGVLKRQAPPYKGLPEPAELVKLVKVHRTYGAVAALFGVHRNTIVNRLNGRWAP